MTGKPYKKTRVIVSNRLLSPSAGRPDFDESATSFKEALAKSVLSPRLDPDIAVKAIPVAQGNSDGKKRTNTGEIPGVVNIDGIRFKPNEKGGEGKVFRWLPGLHSRENQTKKSPNFGWVEVNNEQRPQRAKPEIRVHKYRVSPKTNEPIEGSEERINPYNLASGEAMDDQLKFKKLPGRTIGQIVPGGNLLARSAAKLGIWVDEFNKLRCPPGTPAANQFTDATGSNCFGFSAVRLHEMAHRVMQSSIESSFDEMQNRLAASKPEGRSGLSSGRVSNTPWWKNHFVAKQYKKEQERIRRQGGPRNQYERDLLAGKLELDPKKLSVVEEPSQFRWFVSGAKRARTGLEASKRRVSRLQESLGIAGTDEERAVNADLVATFEELNNRGLLSARLGAGKNFFGGRRPTYEEVVAQVTDRLMSASPEAWDRLSDKQKQDMIKADVERWYKIEREMLEAFLDAYVQMPDHMRKIDWISYGSHPGADYVDEAATYANGDEESWERSGIRIDIRKIMDNQDSMLPSLDEYSRIRVDAIGGSDSENAQELHDFLVSSQIEARRTAALALGAEGFARHIMYHEIGHTVQIAAVGRELKRRVQRGELSGKKLSDFTTMDIIGAIDSVLQNRDDVSFIDSIKGAASRSENVKFLAGSYAAEFGGTIGVAETGAELFALRMSGLIWGDDVDAALEWMDDIADSRYAEDRLGYQQMEEAVFEEAAVTQFDRQGMSAIYKLSLDDARKRKIENRDKNIREVYKNSELMDEDELVSEIVNAEAEYLNAANLADGAPDGSYEKEMYSAEADYYESILSEYQRAGRRKFGNDAASRRRLSEKIREYKEDRNLLSDEEMRSLGEERRAQEVRQNATNDSDSTLMERLIDVEAELASPQIDDRRRNELNDAKRVYKSEIENRRKEEIKGISGQSRLMSEDQIVDEMVKAEAEYINSRDIANSLEDGSPDKEIYEMESRYYRAKLTEYQRAARKKFGDDEDGKKNLRRKVQKYKEQRGLLSDDEMRKLAEKRRTDEILANASNESETRLLDRLADIEAELNSSETNQKRKNELNREKNTYRTEIRNRRKEASPDTTSQNIARFIDKQVSTRLEESGRSKTVRREKPKKVTSKRAAEEHALSERSSLMQKATPQERDAITQMADPSVVDVGNLLDPKAQVSAAKAINKRNRRATKGGNDVDESSRLHGSLAGQVENILIPSLELIDKSELSETVEMEAVLDLSDLQISGEATDVEIDSPSLISGRLITDRTPFSGSEVSANPTDGGKRPTKVVVRVEKGQKGYFPHWSDLSSTKDADYEQKLVLPPGKLKISERRVDRDGNEVIVVEVVKQNDPTESLSSMLSAIGEEGPEPTQHAKGTKKKLERVVNSHLATRRRQGKTKSPETPQKTAQKISEKTNQVKSDISDAGGDGPGGMSPSKASEVSRNTDSDFTDDIFGPVQSKEDRKADREQKHLDVISRMREVIQFGGSDSEIEIDESDITPEVRQMLESMSDQELLDVLAEESRNFHQSLDKRPRVRLRDDELDSLVTGKTKKIGSPEATDEEVDSISLGDKIRDGIRALDTPETRQLLATTSKSALRTLAKDELGYLVDDGRIDEQTKADLEDALDVLIPETEAQVAPVDFARAIKSVLDKRKAEVEANKRRGLSSGAVGTAVAAWNEWNNADPDNLQLTKDIITIALIMQGNKYQNAEEYVFGKFGEIGSVARRAARRIGERRERQTQQTQRPRTEPRRQTRRLRELSPQSR